ncbi:hypothetical protein APE_1901 [Aeropyrum pernix K1]|uniref:Uncharacterized protein n=1 Tax=Aeropyrum pernix (strain ATCC 700893 / DSM 11879 / JCM 9820 / NBRC 100138 / K1) TaxID=272557 RepID=Q9YAP2_AERPE|nr:flagellin [Aeropyrum pernix]BAA80906.1 hypothetical protein APE_1901 [Aeropyrum pernix K1]
MGESTVIAHALLTIVAVTMASIFAGIAIFSSYEIGNSLQSIYKSISDKMRTEVTLVYIVYDEANNLYRVYLKNTGLTPMTNIENMEVFLGPYGGELDYYTYNTTGGQGTWSYVEYGTQDGVWEVGELIELVLNPPSAYSNPVKLILVTPTGAKMSFVEPAG